MSLTILIVLITALVAGVGFWFYNRRQINSLTETIEDKNAVINSFREHLTSPAEDTIPAQSFGQTIPVQFDPESESVIDVRPEKKKKRYNNRPKKAATSIQPAQQPKQNSEKKNRPKPRKKNKPQQ